MSFQNIEVETINWNAVAGISSPVFVNYASPLITNYDVKAPNFYVFVEGITGGTGGASTVTIPAPMPTKFGTVITIVCTDNSTQSGNLLTIISADSSTIYGTKTMTSSPSSAVLQLYNSGLNWIGI
jgi:hypothetical protein